MSSFGKQRHASGGESIMDFNKVWQNFMDLVQNHYMDFNGRIGRAQYWYFILVCFVIGIIAGIVDAVVGMRIIGALVGLGLLLPNGGASARRFQDTGRSGQPLWIWVIVSGSTSFSRCSSLSAVPWGMFYFFITFGWLIGLIGSSVPRRVDRHHLLLRPARPGRRQPVRPHAAGVDWAELSLHRD
jgi:uncharacterized membrane protein YhaH (DUF805 family)